MGEALTMNASSSMFQTPSLLSSAAVLLAAGGAGEGRPSG